MTKLHSRAGAVGLSVLLALGLSGAKAQTTSQTPSQTANQSPGPACFRISDWSGWKLTPDAKSMYIRVGISQIYRLDFGAACWAAQFGNPHLITTTRGPTLVCSPLDLDLRVSQGRDTAVPCIVSNISQLSKDEAAALPRKLRP